MLGYPEPEEERSLGRCADATDNDFDGLIDCSDPDCEGFCPEQSSAACVDGLDNDGDGLVDGADPRCWPGASPAVTRCASFDPVELEERFDAELSPARWHHFGTLPEPSLRVAETQPAIRDDRTDLVLGFSTRGVAEGVMGGISSISLFDGDWGEFEVSFLARLEEGGFARVGWVPAAFAEPGADPLMGADTAGVLAVLDGRAAPSIALQTNQRSQVVAWPSTDAWHAIRFAADSTGLLLQVDGAEVARLPRPEIPPSRLVVWGEAKTLVGEASAVQIDDLRIRLPGTRPCAAVSPQIPLGTTCRQSVDRRSEDVGFTVALAEDSDGSYCAVVTGAPIGSSRPSSVQSWVSADGVDWSPGGAFSLARELELVGAAVAYDEDAGLFRTVVAARSETSAKLLSASAADCAAWNEPADVGSLPLDSEAPSYLSPGLVSKHEVYFTRPPTSSAGRTLWRTRTNDGNRFDLEPSPVAEIPESAHATSPFMVSRVGPSNLVAVYPILPAAGVSGLGLLVAMDGAGTSWQPSGDWPLLSPEVARGGFDSDDIVSGALRWSGGAGLLLYGARGWPLPFGNEGGGSPVVTVGSAKLSPHMDLAVDVPTPIHAPACGDGVCQQSESCSNCNVDCGLCDGEMLLKETFDSSDGSFEIVAPVGMQEAPSMRVSPFHGELLIEPKLPGWMVRELPSSVLGDFDLSFDVHVVPPGGEEPDPGCVWMVGVGERPSASVVDPRGIFVQVAATHPCVPGAPAFSPRVQLKQRAWQPPHLDGGNVTDNPSCTNARAGAVDGRHHIALSKRGHRVSLRVYGSDGCELSGGEALATEYAGALASPSALLVGHPGTFGRNGWSKPCQSDAVAFAIDNVVLSTPPCSEGSASCSDPTTGSGTCVDVASSNEHCGACGRPVGAAEACETAVATCKGTRCEDPATGEPECVDLSTDPSHCGACGATVGPYEECDSGLRMPKTVQVPEGFWIDSTEVTRRQYEAWLATEPSVEGQHPGCEGWHTNFTPVCAWPPGEMPDHPVVCIDWCDAYQYCASVGKRLCGAIGGGPATTAKLVASENQLYAVCTSGGKHAYTYGEEYDPMACFARDNPLVTCVESSAWMLCDTNQVASLDTCQSPEAGYAGIYDLIGNAHEYLDACDGDTSRSDRCIAIGGGSDAWSSISCSYRLGSKSRDTWDVHEGFRCCAW